VFAFAKGGVADLAQPVQVAAQASDVAPGDLLRRSVEMVGAQRAEARQDRVDLGLAGNEGDKSALLFGDLRIGMAPPWRSHICSELPPSQADS
jgi:hypothetical protein